MSKIPTCLNKVTAQPAGAPETNRPKPDRLVRSNPMRETWNLVQADLTAGKVFWGV